MDSSGGDNSPSLSESAGSSSWRRSWDNSSTLSALNIGSGSELDGGDEDKEIASKAVAFVVKSSRKGVVPLCADVANLLKIKWRLERTIKAQQLEIHRLLSSSGAHCNLTATSTQTDFTGPRRSHPCSDGQPDTQTIELSECKEEQQFAFRESPRILHQARQEVLARPVSASRSVESPQEPIPSHKTTISREVQVECPKMLMQKRCEEQLMETLLLNSRLTEDLGNAWRQIELLRDRLKRKSEKHQPEIVSMGKTHHERGHRQEPASCVTDPFPTGCGCVTQALCQVTGLEGCEENQCFRVKANEAELIRARKPSMDCTVPVMEGQLQPGSHCNVPKPRRQKLPISVNDYVIVNGNKSGTARYVGHLDNSGMANAVFVGVELDEPSGKHDGIFEGKRYFQCYENFAIFVPVHEIFYVINRKPKKSISPPGLRSAQHRYSLGSLSNLANNTGGRGEYSHPTRKKKLHSPKDPNPTRRILRRSVTSSSSRMSDGAVHPSQEEWSDSNERTERAPVSPSQPKMNTRTFTITASLPPDFSLHHAPNRASPRKVVRR
ncbi:uncharacterized protein LOC116987578 isoform X2 [Amblyraja radiata]|uniref:uncharacterized protein LOC116987578 isoform X2 n=1 Tax=Amblyraja radiata TaxID=386614 RepID=UPI0014027C09|nr:uncharacterized protein LOC116987578 isoform X2 [Amblyraja radiata]